VGQEQSDQLTTRIRVGNNRPKRMQYADFDNEETPIVVAPPRRELLIEFLKVLTPSLGLLLFLLSLTSKYPWLTQTWIKDILVVLGILVVVWFARPLVLSSLRRFKEKKRDQSFVSTNDARLRQFIRRFAEFVSTNNTRSLIPLIRSGVSLKMTPEQIITGDYIGDWFKSYREQLEFPVADRMQFLARTRELGNLIQQFNSYYVLRTQKQLALATTLPSQQTLDDLATFREEYIAFLRDFELWAKEIALYLQSLGIAEFNAMYQFAPCTNFERVKPFQKNTPS
jgi:hypothetical protein